MNSTLVSCTFRVITFGWVQQQKLKFKTDPNADQSKLMPQKKVALIEANQTKSNLMCFFKRFVRSLHQKNAHFKLLESKNYSKIIQIINQVIGNVQESKIVHTNNSGKWPGFSQFPWHYSRQFKKWSRICDLAISQYHCQYRNNSLNDSTQYSLEPTQILFKRPQMGAANNNLIGGGWL